MIDPVARHVALFNHGVRTGDLSAWLATFADDAVLTFEGPTFEGLPPVAGRPAIETVYAERPPRSEMRLVAGSGVEEGAETAFGEFVWEAVPATGGRFTLHLSGRRLTRLEVVLNAPPPGAPPR